MNCIRIFSIIQTYMYQRVTEIQFTNLDIEKNIQYIFTSNKMLVIHKWSRKYFNKHSITKHILRMSNDVILMVTFVSWNLQYLQVTWHNDDKVTWNFIPNIKLLMLRHGNGKNLISKDTIVVWKDYRKFIGLPVTCGVEVLKGLFFW